MPSAAARRALVAVAVPYNNVTFVCGDPRVTGGLVISSGKSSDSSDKTVWSWMTRLSCDMTT
jgi:hypothetical protein